MDAHIKAGEVYLQPRKAGKKWKQVWLGLYPPSSNGVGRLEIQNATWGGAGGEAWRHQQTHGDKKIRVVRLSDVLSVRRLPPHAEALPKENMSAFCVETEERTMVFAALRDDSIDWVSRLCAVAFQRGSSPLHMEKNQIYVSTEEVCQFSVAVQQTEAATRCSLQGAYWLQVGEEGLTLREAEKKSSVLTWPYALLRRYGKDKMSLSIEAGRRCDSGPGTFTFKTGQNDHIFSLMEIAIKRQRVPAATTLSVSQEAEKAMTTNRCPRSPLPKIPDTANMAAILDNKLKVDVGRPTDSTSDDLESPYSTPADSIVCGGPNSEATGRNLGGKAIIAIQPPPPISTRHAASAGRRGDQSEPLYADPVDCRYLAAKAAAAATAVYVDPATVLPLKPPASPVMVPQIVNYGLPASVAPTTAAPRHPGAVVVGTGSDLSPPPDPVYSEVYDKVGGVAERLGSMAEPVYTEPAPRHETETKTQKPDPFAHLYAQVCKPKPSSSSSAATSSSSSSSSSSSTSSSSNAVAPPPLSSCTSSSSGATVRSAGDCSALSDVIYENLGVI